LSLISNDNNPGRMATLNATLSQAYWFAGLLNQALIANTDALRRVPYIDKHDQEQLGFTIEHWIMSLRGRIFVTLGRFAEAEEWLIKLLQIPTTERNPVLQYIPHYSYVEMAWCRGDASLATEHASRISEIADHSAIPFLQVQALASRGLARFTVGDNLGAVQNLTRAIDFARGANAGRENEPGLLAHLAGVYFRMGEHEKSLTAATEAVQLAQRRTARVAECHASIISAAALAAQGSTAAEHVLQRADELLQTTGALLFEPLLVHARASLAQPTLVPHSAGG
jgi:adenylate cyclase